MSLRYAGESVREYDRVVVTHCNNQCESTCGMLVYVKDNKVVDIKGDPENPNNYGALCCKGSGQFQHIYNPLRLKYPMVRKTLNDEFKRASWDAALDFAAERLLKVKKEYGPEALYIQRTGRSDFCWKEAAARLGKVFGTPNIVGQGPICTESPGVAMHYFFGAKEYGRLTNPSMDWVNSRSLLVAGSNMGANEVITINWVLNAKERGCKVIWVDPRFHPSMAKADIAIRLRPNTDAALVMAMIHVMIQEGLYDKEFVDQWVHGLDEWRPLIDKMPPERAEKITWVPKETIIRAARVIGNNRPFSVTGTLGTAQTYNSNNVNRCYGALVALTGSIGVPGGGWNWLHNCRPPLNPGNDLKGLPEPKRPILSDKLVNMGDVSAAGLANVISTQKPYPIRAVWWNGNMLAQMPNTHKYAAAFKKNIDIAIHNSWHPNFTYHHAHAAFPITSHFEREGLVHHGNNRLLAWYNQSIEPNWECRNDIDVVVGLAERVLAKEEFEKYFPKEMMKERKGNAWIADMVKWTEFFLRQEPMTAGATKKTLDPATTPKGGVMWPVFTEQDAMRFETPEAKLRGKWIMYQEGENYPGSDKRFPTPSGKLEIASSTLRDLGWDYVPQHREGGHTPVSNPKEFANYPVILCTGRIVSSFHEMGHWWPWCDELEPDRFIQVHPIMAQALGIADGDRVIVESERAEIEGFAWVTEETDPRQVWICCSTDEYQPFVPGLTNRNVSFLIDDIIKDPVYNQPEYKAQLVCVYKKGTDKARAVEIARNLVTELSPDYGVDTKTELGAYVNGVAEGGAPKFDKKKEKVVYEGKEIEPGNLIEFSRSTDLFAGI